MKYIYAHPLRLAFIFLWCLLGSSSKAADPEPAKLPRPRLAPDYTDLTIPPNIAPLNFKVEEPGTRFRVELHSTSGKSIVIASSSPSIKIPLGTWHAFLQTNAGNDFYCDISVRDAQNNWKRFDTVTNHIAREEVDSHLYYRLLKPLYSAYVEIGIYQRNLESFEQKPLLRNQKFGNDCLNCHTFLNHRTDTFALHIRGATNVHPMVLVQSNDVVRVDKTMGYLSWHPSGRLLAFTGNKLSLFYHTSGETRDVYDARSRIGIYRVDSNAVVTPKPFGSPNYNDTWPGWSPDGKYLYFCRTAPLPVEKFREIRYDLMRASYDIDSDQWGEPEVLLSAQESGLSAGQPKVSPDGRYVLFCLSKNGNFPVYQPSSDLYVIDLNTRRCRRLPINSDKTDSWHCWSANSRWIVFSTKRLDGLFSRPFFSYVDAQGEFHKPFVLPQEDPAFYDSFAKTFNLPELAQGPVNVTESELARAVAKPTKIRVPQADPQQASQGQQTGTDQPGYRQVTK